MFIDYLNILGSMKAEDNPGLFWGLFGGAMALTVGIFVFFGIKTFQYKKALKKLVQGASQIKPGQSLKEVKNLLGEEKNKKMGEDGKSVYCWSCRNWGFDGKTAQRYHAIYVVFQDDQVVSVRNEL